MKLSEARKKAKLSQEDIARLIGISLRQYQNIESGLSSTTIQTALKICNVLNIEPNIVEEWKQP